MNGAHLKRKSFVLGPALSARGDGRQTDPSAGFTLLEVLVSLAIAMMFMTTLIRVFGANWSEANAVDESLSATTLARAIIADARTGNFEPNSVKSGTTNGFNWRISTLELPDSGEPSGSRDQGASLHANSDPMKVPDDARAQTIIYHVVVDVAAPSGRHDRLEGLVASAGTPLSQK